MQIDTNFNFLSDTPVGKDIDAYSPTLKQFHKTLWNKPLPGGAQFELSDKHPKTYLHHRSELGEFSLSSDLIGITYRGIKKVSSVVDKFASEEIEAFYHQCCTIGAFIIFPSNRINMKMTINGARGCSSRIGDRFDLTLECIRRHFAGEKSPLDETLERYSSFFDLFESFEGYVDFFLLQDLASPDYQSIRYFMPFEDFDATPFPQDRETYEVFMSRTKDFVTKRNSRISAQV
jgi:hypothetical protein